MPQLTFALRFQGAAQRAGPDGNVLTITATAPGGALHSLVDAEGLGASDRPVPGGDATIESELTFTGETTYQETGTIVFGPGDHRLRVSTVGSGHLAPAPPFHLTHGAAIWRVDAGEGRFAHASGTIASILLVADDLTVAAYHVGVLLVP